MAAPLAEWSELLPELLEAIVRMTGDDYDLIRFRAVCSSWRTAGKRVGLMQELPWMLLF